MGPRQGRAEPAGKGRALLPRGHGLQLTGRGAPGRQAPQQIRDHALHAQAHAVVGGIDLLHAGLFQDPGLLGHDHPAAAAKDLDMGGPGRPEALGQVGEELHVPALVGGDADRIRILFRGGLDDLGHAAVMPQVDDLGPLGHQQAPHQIDGRVVAIEKRGGGDDPGGMDWAGTHGDSKAGEIRSQAFRIGLSPAGGCGPLGWTKVHFHWNEKKLLLVAQEELG